MNLRLQNIERWHVGLLAVVVACASLTQWVAPGSVLLGGVVMGSNFWLMRQLFSRMMKPERNPGVVLLLALAKFGLFMGMLALLFWRVRLDAIGFAVGATILLVACLAELARQELVTA